MENVTTADIKKLARTLKMPSGTRVGTVQMGWSKRGGHVGAKTIQRVREHIVKLGFVPYDHRTSSDATGDRVRHGSVYACANVTVTFSSFYGVTAHENQFSITVSLAGA